MNYDLELNQIYIVDLADNSGQVLRSIPQLDSAILKADSPPLILKLSQQ